MKTTSRDMIEEVITSMMTYSGEDREATISMIQRFTIKTDKTVSDTIKYIHRIFKVKMMLDGTAEKGERVEPIKRKTLDDIL